MREHGMNSARVYKRHAKFGGMDASLMKRMRELEDESRRSKNMYLEEKLIAEIARGSSKKFVKPARRRGLAKQVESEYGISVRVACSALSISATCYAIG